MRNKDFRNMCIGAVIGVITMEAMKEKKPEVVENIKNGIRGITRSVKVLYDDFENNVGRILNK